MYPVINNVLIGLNRVGGLFYDYAASVFIQSALLVILLFIIDLLLRKRVRAIFRYCVWLLVLVKLILPPMLSLPTGIGYWVGDHLPAASGTSNRAFDAVVLEHAGPSGEIPQVRPSENVAGDDPAMAPAESVLTPLTWQAVLFILWLAGVSAFLAVLVQRIRFVRGLVAASRPAGDELPGLLEQCRRQMAVRRDIKLRLSETIPSPAVCGLLRPTVLMPTSLVEKLSPEGLRATLIHELAHIKRGDLWINSVQTFLQVVYFYNPFVWFANSIIRKVCEEAVDETVLVALGGQAKDYSNTLIDIGEMVFWKVDLGLRLIGVAESKKALQWRIKHMLNRPIPKSAKLGAIGIAMLIVIAAILLPMAKAQKLGEGSEPTATENEGIPAKSLHEAAADGDIEQVKLLISKGADVNAKDKSGTALHHACEKGRTEVVRLLISYGANVNASSIDAIKPLHYAAISGDKQTVELLLSKGADINAKDWDGRTPLFQAMASPAAGRREVVELLVAKGAKIPALHLAAYMADIEKVKKCLEEGIDINSQEDFCCAALHAAANSGKKDIVEFLISKGATVDAIDSRGMTPLFYAAKHNYEDIADLLLAKGADVNANKGGSTLLYGAIMDDSKDAANLLIRKGANVSARNDDGWTPLAFAAIWGVADMVELLISKGADVNEKSIADYAGDTPLHFAIWNAGKDVVELLISKGADVNAEDGEGHTPLYGAAMLGRKDLVELLTAKGAAPESTIHCAALLGNLAKVKRFIEDGTDVNAKDKGGQTPLFWAVLAGNNDVAKFLIDKGADVNAKDKDGSTALHLVVCSRGKKKKDAVELLLSKGADVNAKDTHGWTPLQLASIREQMDVEEILIDKGADINATCASQKDMTSLHFACVYGDKDMAALLIGKGADVNAKDKDGGTPLHVVCVRPHKDIVELLIAKGADVNAKDNKQQTALSLAKERGHDEIVEFLRKHGAKE
jgi:ankyrin repeat protein/beta-lactamase regulating signal transducer with metallopeptidase domain